MSETDVAQVEEAEVVEQVEEAVTEVVDQVEEAPVTEVVAPVEPVADDAPGHKGDEPFTPTRDEFEAVLHSLTEAHSKVNEIKALVDRLRAELHGITH